MVMFTWNLTEYLSNVTNYLANNKLEENRRWTTQLQLNIE